MFALVRLFLFLITRRWGLIILGAILALGGLFYGVSSHQVMYQTVAPGAPAHYLEDGSTAYLQMQNSETLYIVNENDFSPPLTGSVISNGGNISFVYRPDDTTSVDVTSTRGTHLQGDGYTVVQMTVYDANGQNPQIYTTSEYTQNPNGFYQNNWAGGIVIFLVGLVILGSVFFLPKTLGKKKKLASANGIPPAQMNVPNGMQGQAYPYQQPYQNPVPANPYAQPYQGPAQYPQYPQQPQQPQSPAQYGSNVQYPQYPQSGSNEPTQFAGPYNPPPRN